VEGKVPVYLIGYNDTFGHALDLYYRGLPSPINLSSSRIEFKDQTIPLSGQPIEYEQFFEFNNESSSAIKWNIVISGTELPEFYAEPVKGILEIGSLQRIKVIFHPQKNGFSDATLKLSLIQQNLECSIPIELTGNAIHPTIVFEPSEIFLPITPRTNFTDAKVFIHNIGCQLAEITPLPPPDIKKHGGMFEFQFPEGGCLKGDGERLPCIIKYTRQNLEDSSFVPVSFTVRIPFEDSEKNKFYLKVHGTSDNSVLTLLPYFALADAGACEDSNAKQYILYNIANTYLICL
jgi:hypothetical protein